MGAKGGHESARVRRHLSRTPSTGTPPSKSPPSRSPTGAIPATDGATASVSGDATTDLSRDSSSSMGATNLLGFTKALAESHPDLDTAALVSLMSSSEFSGKGDTSRGTRAKAQIAVRVRHRLKNGDLFIEGNKIILVNSEELHIYVSGVVRPQDIGQDNRVPSSMIADAQIEFTGRGDVTEVQQQGWLARFLSEVNPF